MLESGTADFTTADDAAERSPLAARLFGVDGVAAVFLGSDFITITKSSDKEWYVMKPAVLGAIMEHMTTDQPIMSISVTDTARTPLAKKRAKWLAKLRN